MSEISLSTDNDSYLLKCPECGNTNMFTSSERVWVDYYINRYGEYTGKHVITDEDESEECLRCGKCGHEIDYNAIPEGFAFK